MQKAGIREPIYLTKLKRRSKMDEYLPQRNELTKEKIKYDIQVFQESIDTHKMRQTCQVNQSTNESAFNSNNNHRTKSSSISFLNNRQAKVQINRALDESGENSFLNTLFSQNISHSSLVHISKMSLPNDNSKKINKQNTILDQPQLVNLKARAIRTINNCKADVLKEIRLFESNNVNEDSLKFQKEYEKNKNIEIDCLKAQYEGKINRLEEKNKQYEKKVSDLQSKLKEKEAIAMRVMKIQKDLAQLYQQNQQLQRLNESLSQSQIKTTTIQAYIQTQSFPLFVQDSFCQTYIQSPELQSQFSQPRITELNTNEEWFNRAKMWKYQLQREKVINFNQQTEFNAILENVRIQNRQRMEIMQKQMQIVTMKFESKCQQVKQKQSIISKYLLRKSS